jgi:hypothetical protein
LFMQQPQQKGDSGFGLQQQHHWQQHMIRRLRQCLNAHQQQSASMMFG